MMSVADKLQLALSTKERIRQQLISEGKVVPESVPFSKYPDIMKWGRIPGIISSYSGKGLTNEQMAANPVWMDVTGNGYDLQFKNFGWKLNSGCGIYPYDFTKFGISHDLVKLVSPSVVEYFAAAGRVGMSFQGSSFKAILKITGLDRLKLQYPNVKLSIYGKGVSVGNGVMLKEGINIIDYTSTESNLIYLYTYDVGTVTFDQPITIEQIPDYQGAICFDGVDDYAICETFPILTKEKGYTVMALRSWISRDKDLDGFVSNINKWNSPDDGAFVVEYKNGTDYAITFGNANTLSGGISNNILIYQTSTDYNGGAIIPGSLTEGSNILTVGKLAKEGISIYPNVVVYALCIIDHDTTPEERQVVIDYWKEEFPELFPDQAWTVTGKSNEDADRSTIENLTGNGNGLVLSNFAFAENSGYNSDGYLVTDGVDDRIISGNFELGENWTMVGDWKMLDNTTLLPVMLKSSSFVFEYINDVFYMCVRNPITSKTVTGVNSIKAICSDGRIYLHDGTEIIDDSIQTYKGEISPIYIGTNKGGTKLSKIAFKSLSIYKDKILTKEQCIRAYDYLQTLKAK